MINKMCVYTKIIVSERNPLQHISVLGPLLQSHVQKCHMQKCLTVDNPKQVDKQPQPAPDAPEWNASTNTMKSSKYEELGISE